MNWIIRLFSKEKNKLVDFPHWEEIIKLMRDQNLHFSDDIVQIIYSRDGTKRYVVLKSEHGFYKYVYEELLAYDEEELRWLKSDSITPDSVLPAYWCPNDNYNSCSFYESVQKVNAAIVSEYPYVAYFE